MRSFPVKKQTHVWLDVAVNEALFVTLFDSQDHLRMISTVVLK